MSELQCVDEPIVEMRYAHVCASEFTIFNEDVPLEVCARLISQDTRSKGQVPSLTERIQRELATSALIKCRLVVDDNKIFFFDAETGVPIAEQDSVFEEIHPGLWRCVEHRAYVRSDNNGLEHVEFWTMLRQN